MGLSSFGVFDYICLIFISCFQAKTKGIHTKNDVGVKYAAKKQRKFTPEKMKEGDGIIIQQVR